MVWGKVLLYDTENSGESGSYNDVLLRDTLAPAMNCCHELLPADDSLKSAVDFTCPQHAVPLHVLVQAGSLGWSGVPLATGGGLGNCPQVRIPPASLTRGHAGSVGCVSVHIPAL